jgi:hypothetical protein
MGRLIPVASAQLDQWALDWDGNMEYVYIQTVGVRHMLTLHLLFIEGSIPVSESRKTKVANLSLLEN